MWQSAGIANLLVSNQVVAPRKIQRLVDIAAAGARVSVCVDNQMVLEATAAMAQAAGTELGVVVEVRLCVCVCAVHHCNRHCLYKSIAPVQIAACSSPAHSQHPC